MEKVLQTLAHRKTKLRRSKLCEYLDTAHDHSISNKLSFAPAMLFFAMGFKDILQNLKDDASQDAMQRSVNIHCDEDGEHWKWYLNDLTKIPNGKYFLKKSYDKIFAEIWSERYASVRHLVYNCMHLSKMYTSPFHRLVIIESLEGTFDCFNESVFELVARFGLDEELEYFGQVHAHSEADHAMERSADGHESNAYNGYQPSVAEVKDAVTIIEAIFEDFEKVFECWYLETGRAEFSIC